MPNYHRQRFLLTLLYLAGGELSEVDMQKLAFLAHHEFEFKYYDFVPFHFGCYSFQMHSDVKLMEENGWLRETENHLALNHNAGGYLDDAQLGRLRQLLTGTGKLRGKKLLAYVYEHYPYYAMRSRIADDMLNPFMRNRVNTIRRKLQNDTRTLFTIGYEGLSFEAYINRLIQHDVRLLCDVRKNPLSRKFGFSKASLSQRLPELGIEYRHIPELGIPSALRQSLNIADDYTRLFARYRRQLPEQADSLSYIEKLLEQYTRVALTCFEKAHSMCHRHCVSDLLAKERSLTVCHL